MLKSLKRKLLAMMMTMVSLVLLTVFAALLAGTYSGQKANIDQTLARALGPGFGMDMPKEPFGRQVREERIMTSISLLVNGQGEVLFSTADSVDISAEDLALATEAALTGPEQGWLRELGLFYMRRDTVAGALNGGQRSAPFEQRAPDSPESGGLSAALEGRYEGEALSQIAFVSDHTLRQAMRDLIGSSLLVGCAALILLFLISLFLAGWALRPVERAWDQQRQFVSDASHELKTPLTVILANLDILRRHEGDSIRAQRKWLDSSEAEAQHMKQLVEDLLTLARLDEAGHTAPLPAMCAVDLTDAVLSSLLTFEPVAFEQGLRLDSSLEPGICVNGDEARLRQLTTILLDNACKYAGKGGSVTVSLTASGDKARLSVSNTGDVIPPEQLRHLFERFYRADPARPGGQTGYGLGLAIASGIAQLHSGRITALSDAEHGTVFSVTLPRLEAAAKGGQSA